MIKLALFILYLIQLLPFKLIGLLADAVGTLAYYAVAPRRKVGQTNLARCFPELSAAERTRILKAHFQQMARLLLEYGLCWYGSAARLRGLVDYRDKHYLDEALAAGNKVILLYPHFTAFELAVFRLNQDVPLISIYSQQKNRNIDAQILQGRRRYGNAFLVTQSEGLRGVIRKIRSGTAPFLYLPDQDFGPRDSVFVPFFGIATATITGLSRLAKLTGAVVIPAIPIRGRDNRVTLTFYPPWQDFPGTDAVADAARMNAFIEARVREHPEQYYWLHKRFKTRPDGEAPFYD